MKRGIILLLAGVLLSCANDDYTEVVSGASALDRSIDQLLEEHSEGQGKTFFLLPDETDFSAIPQDPNNPLTAVKVRLGGMLLHETAIGSVPKMSSEQGMYSCATCHPVAAGFNSGLRQGIGEGGMGFGSFGDGRLINPSMPIDSVDVEPIRPPTLLNLAYQDVMLWNGSLGGVGTNAGTEAVWSVADLEENFLGLEGIETQAIIGQRVHRMDIDENWVTQFNYKIYFDAAFPDIPVAERYTRITAGLAIAAYNRTLLANQAPWQRYLRGELDVLSDQEKRGAQIFLDKGKCVECHTGPALKDGEFHAFGMGDIDFMGDSVILDAFNMEAIRRGRGGFTGNPQDMYKFKTPTLYNVADAKFLGHGATFETVRDVLVYKNQGIAQEDGVPATNLADQFGDTFLTEEELDDLTAFIENGLRDPNLTRYLPDSVLSNNCIPNNDPTSRIDLGCY